MVEGTHQLQQNGPQGFFMHVQADIICTGLRAYKVLWAPSEQLLLQISCNDQFRTE